MGSKHYCFCYYSYVDNDYFFSHVLEDVYVFLCSALFIYVFNYSLSVFFISFVLSIFFFFFSD